MAIRPFNGPSTTSNPSGGGRGNNSTGDDDGGGSGGGAAWTMVPIDFGLHRASAEERLAKDFELVVRRQVAQIQNSTIGAMAESGSGPPVDSLRIDRVVLLIRKGERELPAAAAAGLRAFALRTLGGRAKEMAELRLRGQEGLLSRHISAQVSMRDLLTHLGIVVPPGQAWSAIHERHSWRRAQGLSSSREGAREGARYYQASLGVSALQSMVGQ